MQDISLKKKIIIASVSLCVVLAILFASIFALASFFRSDIRHLLVGIKDKFFEITRPEPDVETVTQYDGHGDVLEIPDWIEVDLLPINEYSRPGEATEDLCGIVIHYVGNAGSSAKANRNYFANLANTHQRYASSNFIIGIDGEIIQCVPLGEIAYASNERNSDTISIECCHPDASGKFTDETYASLIKLCVWLCQQYDIEPDEIIRHYDVTGKPCPLYFVENEDEWAKLKDDIMMCLS